MSAKQFFKGKAFKCIIVLLCILLVSGTLLAVCWGFLEVTDEERFARKIRAVYGGETVTAVEVDDLSDWNTKVNGATIQKMWYVEEKNDYLVQASSRGNGGDIICWIAVSLNDGKTEVTGISKVILYGVGDPAEFTGNIPSSVYNKFSEEYTDGIKFEYGTDGSDQFIKTNASYTMTAICNDVNGAVAFVKAYISGENIVDPYEDFEYREHVNMDKTSWKKDGNEITYNIVTSGLLWKSFTFKIKVDKVDDVIKTTDYEIIINGSSSVESGADKNYADSMSETAKNLKGKILSDILGYLSLNDNVKDDVINTGATLSNRLCYESVAFALANYELCLTADKEVTENE